MNKHLTRLANGLKVLVIKDVRFPLVCTRLYVHTGSANEEPAQAGISHLLEHMVFKGTEHRAKGQVAKDVESLGGYLNATTGFDRTCYITDMPAENWRTGIDVVKEMAFQAQLDPAELNAEKTVVISELEGNEDSPGRNLFERMQTAALADTAYGRPIIGYRETIRAITAKDLQDYVKRWYQPQNMMLVVAGDVDPHAVLEHAEKAFGNLVNTIPMPENDEVFDDVVAAQQLALAGSAAPAAPTTPSATAASAAPSTPAAPAASKTPDAPAASAAPAAPATPKTPAAPSTSAAPKTPPASKTPAAPAAPATAPDAAASAPQVPGILKDADTKARVHVVHGPWNKVYLGIAFPVPGLLDMRSVDLDVLAHLLGGDGTSRFYRKYEYERQLVDAISVHNMGMQGAGLFTVTARLDPEKVATFWQELMKDMAGLKSVEFKEEAVERARYNIEDDMDRASETLSGLTGWQGYIHDQLGGAQGEENLRHALKGVDRTRLTEAINKWLVPGRARVRVLAPTGANLPDFEAVMAANWSDKTDAKPAVKAETLDKPETLDLGKGRKVLLLPDDSVPYISLEIKLPGGNALLTPEQQGLAELTARTLTDGCGTRDNQAMERFFSERAASISASASRQSFTIKVSGPSRYTDDYLSILKDIIVAPRFEAKEVSREANEMKAALRQRQDSPMSELFAKLAPFLYSDKHPYGFDTLGTAQNLDRFNRNDVVQFWSRQLAQPVVLSVAGDIRRKSVVDFAGSLTGTDNPPLEVAEPVWGKDRELTLHMPGRNQTHYMELFKTVPMTHPDAPALMLLKTALSGQSGLLFTRLRDDQGLGYTVTSINRTLQKAGWLAFYIGTTPERLEQSVKGISAVIADLVAKPLPEALLKAASNRMKGEYHRGRQSLGSRAEEAAVDALLGYPPQFRLQLLNKAASLTPGEVHAVAKRYLLPASAYRITMQP
ncbi:MAG: insulinase family protein [Desulfovibrio sp.]|nr:insulinase family protein [Desulfovibrio sp.]